MALEDHIHIWQGLRKGCNSIEKQGRGGVRWGRGPLHTSIRGVLDVMFLL